MPLSSSSSFLDSSSAASSAAGAAAPSLPCEFYGDGGSDPETVATTIPTPDMTTQQYDDAAGAPQYAPFAALAAMPVLMRKAVRHAATCPPLRILHPSSRTTS